MDGIFKGQGDKIIKTDPKTTAFLLLKKKQQHWDASVAQSVNRLTLDFSSGPDLMVMSLSPESSSLTAQSLAGIPSLALSLSAPPHSLALTLSQTK